MTENLPSVKTKQDLTANYEDQVEFYQQKEHTSKRDFLDDLSKGKYDIDFSIGICQHVIKHCDDHVLSAGNFGISLKHSLKKLMTFLQQEKQGKQTNPVILFTCEKCQESEPIFAKNAKDHQCNFCYAAKAIEYIEG